MIRISLRSKIMEKNDRLAEANRTKFKDEGILCFNMIGSPGSGKTTLLEAAFSRIDNKYNCAVIEGDVKTDNDMRRIEKVGVRAVQIQTNGSCHLNAEQVGSMLSTLPISGIDLLIIENVGNLICPVSYDLGEEYRMIVMSVTEGEDKPLKYPSAFMSADMTIITKIDLAPYVDASPEKLKANALSINPNLKVVSTSAKTGEGMDRFLKLLMNSRGAFDAKRSE